MYFRADRGCSVIRVSRNYSGEVRLVDFYRPRPETQNIRHLTIYILEEGRIKAVRTIVNFFDHYDLSEEQRIDIRINLLNCIPQQIFY